MARSPRSDGGDGGRPNPFLNPAAVTAYEAWYHSAGRQAARQEKALLNSLLAGFPGARTVLEVGCGTGHFLRWLGDQGLQATGLDSSPAMLAEARRLDSPPCVEGDAHRLPFAGGSFDLVAMITTLEFVADPLRALGEAARVARGGLILGVLNRQSLLGRRLQRSPVPLWQAARFFTPAELAGLATQAAGGKVTGITWRTTLWPGWPGALPLPWGGFIGMAVRYGMTAGAAVRRFGEVPA